jgi:hypothetical protein
MLEMWLSESAMFVERDLGEAWCLVKSDKPLVYICQGLVSYVEVVARIIVLGSIAIVSKPVVMHYPLVESNQNPANR